MKLFGKKIEGIFRLGSINQLHQPTAKSKSFFRAKGFDQFLNMTARLTCTERAVVVQSLKVLVPDHAVKSSPA
jgi:hypothetical protein